MKKILLVSQSQDGSYVNILNEASKSVGCSLTVYTGKDSGINSDVEVVQGTHYDSNSFRGRLKTWLSFVKGVKQYLRSNIDKFDLVFFTSNPPVNQSLVKYTLKKKKKAIYLVWDIYPDCIEKSFGIKVKPITDIWRKINRKLYKKCDAVITIGEIMKGNLRKSYDSDFEVIPYHTDTNFIKPIDSLQNIFINNYNLSGKKIFMYSGKMGYGHGFNELLSVASELKDRTDIEFVFIGFGAAYDDIKTYVNNNNLENVLVLPYQPLEMLPFTLGAADVSFVTIKKETDGLFLPSKVYDAMASGSAILCISDGNNDVSKMVETESIGINVSTGNTESLKNAILRLGNNTSFCTTCQEKARQQAVKKYDIGQVTIGYATLFERILNS